VVNKVAHNKVAHNKAAHKADIKDKKVFEVVGKKPVTTIAETITRQDLLLRNGKVVLSENIFLKKKIGIDKTLGKIHDQAHLTRQNVSITKAKEIGPDKVHGKHLNRAFLAIKPVAAIIPAVMSGRKTDCHPNRCQVTDLPTAWDKISALAGKILGRSLMPGEGAIDLSLTSVKTAV
jgi:hypothetical protein